MLAKLLIVEDEAITAIDIKNILEIMGFEVVSTATEGKEAIQKAGKLKPDLILMDISLKGEIDGIEAADDIMALFDIPVIYLTAYSDKKTFERAKLTKPYGFITKPFNHDELKASIEIAIYKHELDKKLKESEEKFHLLYQDAPLPYQSLTESGHIIEVNQAWLDTLGYSKDEVIGKWFGNFLKADNTKKFIENFPKFKAKGEICNIEFEMERKDGSTLFTEFNGKISYDEKGNFQRTQCIFQDITKQINAEKKLRKSKERYEQFFNNSLMGFALCKIIVDDENNPVDFTYLKVNKAFENFTGLKREEVLNKKVTDVFPYEEVAEIIQIYGKVALTGGSTIFEYPIPSLDKYYEISAFSPRNKHFIAFFTDITERKRAEEALKSSEQNLKNIFDSAPIDIAIIGLDNKIIDVNTAVLKLYGFSRKEELIGKDMLSLVDKEYHKKVAEKWRELLKKGYVNDVELVQLKKDGQKINTIISATLLNDDAGKPYAFLSMGQDITERKKLEEELKKSHDNLELKVEERTAELDVLIDELKRSNAELQQFAYVSSHDLQEPLRTIASFTQLLERRYKGQLDSDADEFMDYIVEATKRMQQLINDLLEYSRVTTKGKELKQVDTNEALDNALQNLKSSTKECNAEITHDKLPTVMADKTQLIQLFQNLIGNSIKFKKPDKPAKIHISATKDEEKGEYVFSVKDNGIGMEPQYAERIFIIFQRLHTREKYKGTGIGLSISKKIIERHGGHIWVESENGVGSTFYFTIPIINE